MNIDIRLDLDGPRARVAPIGAFDLPRAAEIARTIADVATPLSGARHVDVDLSGLTRVDGSGAAFLARWLDDLEATGAHTVAVSGAAPDAARLIALNRRRRSSSSQPRPVPGALSRIGAAAASLPGEAVVALHFLGSVAAALPKVVVAPRSIDWRSLPRLVQEVGADALPVTSAANLLVGVIIGFLGVSQLGRFGALAYVPELVVVAHFRELGPLVTAIVVAGRSGAGLASELATMKVSEEVDALRSMGFAPVAWLVVPRCLALVLTLPLLAWIGDVLALAGGLAATTVVTDMTGRAYVLATAGAITATDFLAGLVKTPALALAIGLVACGQGLAARGGAAAVGARTTSAVVLAIFGVIVVSAVFTVVYALAGI
ncbi:ABC transporter permease [Luteitalea sp. TBR-22]|uniref:ABC transporter permease n=1 Tax=Luteitalea sp. TBR-22 TaxID=2802971 RepID=UPI001AF152A7|nr:ABC transporter permease [Luteitalea sp. TBR-22]BCS35001.1 ABC transporter permease [Luteitalea sp. TBR-22]